MTIDTTLAWSPRQVSPPGDTLTELLEERGWSQAELARRMGRPSNAISEITLGEKEITEHTALELERVLGTPAQFWLARESRYRESLARQREAARAPEQLDWLDQFPIKQLQEAGCLPPGRLTPAFKATLVAPLLAFFGVASPEGWQQQYLRLEVAFRRASPRQQTNNAAITAWLRLGEIAAAQARNLPAYDAATLQAHLSAMRALTLTPATAIGPALHRLCAQAGVVLAFVPSLAGTHVSGVARWLGDRPLVQLSLRGKRNDVFWFSFFHEIGHILKHPAKRAVFLDDASAGSTASSREEQEANQFAADVLIPPAEACRLGQIDLTADAVRQFSQEIGVHPGIVVGRLQHLGLIGYGGPWEHMKDRYEIAASQEHA
ncbi:helix-turn-helix domain-containing protein [Ottowia testudinis]|uniref:Helix-turn-helix domain-containing protein n=1 Tax=Ottowia testudinis TaxID=2816950 RepID=A0A975CG84_9BURK|nr:helix-turn-helix domain-containing protein [Ottowia testudinis]QTD45222.1 helix-turn-helix domain-containing protein [Ottowia testudinis]